MARRPSDHRQRSSCLAAVDDLLSYADTEGQPLPESISAVLQTMFMPVCTRYKEARRLYRTARAARHAATRAAHEADKVFDQTGREWIKGVTDGKGHHLPREFAKLLEGTLPSDLFQLPYRNEIDLTKDLLEQLVHFPHLKGDPGELSAFMAAHASLAAAVKALEAARREQRSRKAELDTASSQFDKKWSAMAEVIEEVSPELAAKFLPDFSTRPSRPRPGGKRQDTGQGLPVEAGSEEVDADDLDALDELDALDDEVDGSEPETDAPVVCASDVPPELT